MPRQLFFFDNAADRGAAGWEPGLGIVISLTAGEESYAPALARKAEATLSLRSIDRFFS
jgi:hypothetical protein